MFQQAAQNNAQQPPAAADDTKSDDKLMYKYKSFLNSQILSETATNNSMVQIDALLETEKKTMNTESWNKLDKRLKIQKLHAFAEKYAREECSPREGNQESQNVLQRLFKQRQALESEGRRL